MGTIRRLLLGGDLDRDVLDRTERSTFVVVDDPLRQYTSFGLRLVLAAVIATAGIAADSSTTIIGAMLVAPLMSPMLGTALATALGRPGATLRTLAQTVAGMALVVGVSMLVTAIIPVDMNMDTNSQVLARVSPRLVDLIIALASGFMAALASMRSDIPDAVPGIAISASIVPPLCVVGAGLYEGAYAASLGAFLLFFANFIAIQAMGALVFLLMGLGARHLSRISERSRAVWYAFVAAGAVAVAVLLGSTSSEIVQAAERDHAVQDVALAWVGEGGYRVSGLDVVGDELYVEVSGTGEVPSAEELERLLGEAGVEFERISVSVRDEVTVVR